MTALRFAVVLDTVTDRMVRLGARSECGAVCELLFEGRGEALGDSFVVAVASSVHAAERTVVRKHQAAAGILATSTVVHPSRRWLSRPADDASREQGAQHSRVRPALISPCAADVADRRRIRRRATPWQRVLRDEQPMIRTGGVSNVSSAASSDAAFPQSYGPLLANLAQALTRASVAGFSLGNAGGSFGEQPLARETEPQRLQPAPSVVRASRCPDSFAQRADRKHRLLRVQIVGAHHRRSRKRSGLLLSFPNVDAFQNSPAKNKLLSQRGAGASTAQSRANLLPMLGRDRRVSRAAGHGAEVRMDTMRGVTERLLKHAHQGVRIPSAGLTVRALSFTFRRLLHNHGDRGAV